MILTTQKIANIVPVAIRASTSRERSAFVSTIKRVIQFFPTHQNHLFPNMNQQRRTNRQPRSDQTNQNSNRGNSHRGSSKRGTFNQHGTRTPFQPRSRDGGNVPSYSSIHPNTPVSIILKIDQPTGHEVKGIVAELLTRGDHPRGVKVRLRDGRVGRVQRIVSLEEGERGENLVGGEGVGLGRNGESGGGVGERGARRGGGRIERDVRENDEWFYDEERRGKEGTEGLFAALEEADRRHDAGRWGDGGVGDIGRDSASHAGSEVVKCPVCGDFEGDERAVAHHVEGHFAE